MEVVKVGPLDVAYECPAAGAPFAGVIVLHDAVGLSDDARRITSRLVGHGYAAACPDLYSYGRPKAVCVARTMVEMVRGGDGTARRVGAVREWLAARPEVAGRPVGLVGFCMGGGFALTVGARGGFGATAPNYGRVPKRAEELRGICPVVASFGADDRMLRADPERLSAHLAELGVDHDIEVYRGVGHSFMNDHRGGIAGRLIRTYDERAAEDAWRRILAFFDRHLGGAPLDR
ncbi:MAG TPA: dienelactone hydrolase family protein [Acidimicrobiales bacterium]|nr:dienelactone hydrolase family protein [Acidimicrobiales bacterium]